MLDLFGTMMLNLMARSARKVSALAAFVDRHLEFVPAMNIEHRIERTGAFVTLIFGYSVIAVLYQGRIANDFNAFYGKVSFGLCSGRNLAL